ncbi:MAG: YhcH/YjgK/YiaL family protein [candidate division Zixibacteria bacterium]|nr:YhcH/YjgK/YiaL family protein [candidate division Zixibacteria bacterium]
MIFDRLEHATRYEKLGERLAAAFRYLAENDFAQIAPGRYELDGENLYAMVQQYDTKPKAKGVWEAHRRYIDVQYVAEGVEHMGYAPLSTLRAGEYHNDGDYVLLEGQGQFVVMTAGTVVVLAPQDAHMPGMAVDTPQPVRKVVVKVKID